MQGLLKKAGRGSQQGPAQPNAQQSAAQSLSSEQMKQVKEGFQLGQQVLYQKQVFDGIMADAQEQPPEQVLAQSIVAVLRKVQERVGKLDLMVAATLGIALLGDIVDALQQMGMELGEEQQTAAFQVATEMWLAANSSQYEPQEIESAMQQLGGQ